MEEPFASLAGTDRLLPAHVQELVREEGVQGEGGRGAGGCSLNKVPRGFCYLSLTTWRTASLNLGIIC